MRLLFLFLIALLTSACAATETIPVASVPSDKTESAHALRYKTVALVAKNSDGEVRAYCSGVWVSQSLILTANHCVSDSMIGDKVAYVTVGDVFDGPAPDVRSDVKTRPAVVYAKDEAHDLALLFVTNAPTHLSATPSSSPVVQGAFAQAMGHSLGLWWSYSSGDVSAVRKMEINGLNIVWVQTTAPVSPGNSGGGLFDEHGDLIGICHGVFTRGELLNVFVHRDHVVDFLRKA